MPNASVTRASLTFAVIALRLCSALVFGQGVEARTRYKSPAEEEAEQKVSLSAERIIALLGQEPGLLLQVKRILVRKAYEQGRILDPADLTDDALFRLLREDDTIRVLATQEIENRNYIRAKPTREEIERERDLPPLYAARTTNELSSAPGRSDTRQPGAQEEAYWSAHEQERNGTPRPEQQWPQPSQVPVPLQNPSPPPNGARQLQMTGLPENQDFYDGLGPDPGSQAVDAGVMTRISPEQLPSILNASSSTALHPLATDSAILGRTGRSPVAPGATAPLSAPLAAADSRALPVPQASVQFSPRPMVELDLDRPMIAHRPNPYDDVPSLNDLYAQVSQRPAVLERFGASIFRNGTGNLDRLPH